MRRAWLGVLLLAALPDPAAAQATNLITRVNYDDDAVDDFVHTDYRSCHLFLGSQNATRPWVYVVDLYGRLGHAALVADVPVFLDGYLYVPKLEFDRAIVDVFALGGGSHAFAMGHVVATGATSLQIRAVGDRVVAVAAGKQVFVQQEIRGPRLLTTASPPRLSDEDLFVADLLRVKTSTGLIDHLMLLGNRKPAQGFGLLTLDGRGKWFFGPSLPWSWGASSPAAVLPLVRGADVSTLLLKTRSHGTPQPWDGALLFGNFTTQRPYFMFTEAPIVAGTGGYFIAEARADYDGDGYPEAAYVLPPHLVVGQLNPYFRSYVQVFGDVWRLDQRLHGACGDFDGDGATDLLLTNGARRFNAPEFIFLKGVPRWGQPSLVRM